MAVSLQVYNYFSVLVDGELIQGGSLEKPATISVAGEVHKFVYSVEANTTQEVFDVRDTLGDFDFCFIQCDRNVMLQIQSDITAAVGTGIFSVPLTGTGEANKYGPAFQLHRDDSYASDLAEDFSAGTLDTIDRLVVKNLDTTNAAKVKITVVT